MSTAKTQLQRGEERVVVTCGGDTLDPSSPWKVVVFEWPTWSRRSQLEIKGSKAAKAACRTVIAELHAAGFQTVEAQWAEPVEATPAVRTWGERVPLAVAEAWVSTAFTEPVALDAFDLIDKHDGSLHVEGDLFVDDALIVTGDLHVAGALTVGEGAALVVGGDTRCSSAQLFSEVACRGTVFAETYVYANSGNDHAFFAGGLRATVFVEAGTATFVEQLSAAVCRTMNAVASIVDGQQFEYPKRSMMQAGELRALGLSDEAVDELLELR